MPVPVSNCVLYRLSDASVAGCKCSARDQAQNIVRACRLERDHLAGHLHRQHVCGRVEGHSESARRVIPLDFLTVDLVLVHNDDGNVHHVFLADLEVNRRARGDHRGDKPQLCQNVIVELVKLKLKVGIAAFNVDQLSNLVDSSFAI